MQIEDCQDAAGSKSQIQAYKASEETNHHVLPSRKSRDGNGSKKGDLCKQRQRQRQATAKGKQVKGKIAKRRRNCSYWVDRACAKIDFAKFVEAQTLRTGFSWLPRRPTLKEVPI